MKRIVRRRLTIPVREGNKKNRMMQKRNKEENLK
jgi:hypothetical protein